MAESISASHHTHHQYLNDTFREEHNTHTFVVHFLTLWRSGSFKAKGFSPFSSTALPLPGTVLAYRGSTSSYCTNQHHWLGSLTSHASVRASRRALLLLTRRLSPATRCPCSTEPVLASSLLFTSDGHSLCLLRWQQNDKKWETTSLERFKPYGFKP